MRQGAFSVHYSGTGRHLWIKIPLASSLYPHKWKRVEQVWDGNDLHTSLNKKKKRRESKRDCSFLQRLWVQDKHAVYWMDKSGDPAKDPYQESRCWCILLHSYKKNEGAEKPTRDLPREEEKLSKVLRNLSEQGVFDVNLSLFKIASQSTRDGKVSNRVINHLCDQNLKKTISNLLENIFFIKLQFVTVRSDKTKIRIETKRDQLRKYLESETRCTEAYQVIP